MDVYMALAVMLAYMVKGICGFADAILFTTAMSFQADNVNISPISLILGYPANCIMAWTHRRRADRRVWLPISLMLILGSIPGALFLKNTDAHVLKILLGILVVAIGVEMLLRQNRPKRPSKLKFPVMIVGLISGVLCGLYGIGVLMAAYLGHITEDTDSFKANISIIFIFENTFRIIFYSIIGILTVSTLLKTLMLIPFMLLGLWIGIRIAKHTNEKHIRIIVILALILSGAALSLGV